MAFPMMDFMSLIPNAAPDDYPKKVANPLDAPRDYEEVPAGYRPLYTPSQMQNSIQGAGLSMPTVWAHSLSLPTNLVPMPQYMQLGLPALYPQDHADYRAFINAAAHQQSSESKTPDMSARNAAMHAMGVGLGAQENAKGNLDSALLNSLNNDPVRNAFVQAKIAAALDQDPVRGAASTRMIELMEEKHGLLKKQGKPGMFTPPGSPPIGGPTMPYSPEDGGGPVAPFTPTPAPAQQRPVQPQPRTVEQIDKEMKEARESRVADTTLSDIIDTLVQASPGNVITLDDHKNPKITKADKTAPGPIVAKELVNAIKNRSNLQTPEAMKQVLEYALKNGLGNSEELMDALQKMMVKNAELITQGWGSDIMPNEGMKFGAHTVKHIPGLTESSSVTGPAGTKVHGNISGTLGSMAGFGTDIRPSYWNMFRTEEGKQEYRRENNLLDVILQGLHKARSGK